jgi:hypothetical protein
MSLTKLSLAGKKFNYSRPGKVWLVTSRLETGKSITFFTVYDMYENCTVHVVEKLEIVFLSRISEMHERFLSIYRNSERERKNEVFFGADNDDADTESGHHKFSKTTGSYNTNNLLHSYSMLYTVLISLFISLFMDI